MSQEAILTHITGRIRADVHFLVAEGLMSRYDADQLISKLPRSASSTATDSDSDSLSQPLRQFQLASPPPSATTTPQNDKVFRRNNHPPNSNPIPAPPSHPPRNVPQARAIWGYNEDEQEPSDLSFPPGAIIDIIEETNTDWWKGRVDCGREGLFPSTYVEKITLPSPTTTPARPPPTKSAAQPPLNHANNGRSTSNTNSSAKFVPPPSPYIPPQNQNQWNAQPPPQQLQADDQGLRAPPPEKKSKFGRFGRQAGDAAVSGVGFGAGAAIGSGIVNAIF